MQLPRLAVHAIMAAHAADPVRVDGRGAEELYAERMLVWLARHTPDAGEALRLAALCQHLERWSVARASYPLDKTGYLQWRRFLYTRQAERAREMLTSAGVAAETADRVAFLVAKNDLKSDPDSQALEDAACLVFLDSEIPKFAAAHADYPAEKFIDILAKTWRKMGQRGRELALTIALPPGIGALVTQAVERASTQPAVGRTT